MVDKLSQSEVSNYKEVSRDDLEKGDVVVVEWEPYDWAKRTEDYVNKHKAEVVGISHDIKLKLSNGKTLTDLVGRKEVTGTSENKNDVPDYTDVGYGINKYYK